MIRTDSDLIERVGGEEAIGRLAGALYVEMIPDHRLAGLFRGYADDELVAQQERLLRHLLTAGISATDRLELGDVFAPLATTTPSRRTIKAMAEIMIDCMVDERVPTDIILTALDRLHALVPGVLPESTAAWDLGWSPRMAS